MTKKILPGILLFMMLLSPVVSGAQAPSPDPLPQGEDKGEGVLNGVLAVGTYDKLVAAIRKARAASRARVEKAVEQERVRERWEIGKLIDAHVLQHQRADYGKQVLLRLSKDLAMSETELGYMLQFARAYPISQPAGKLSWSHYIEILSLNDEEERNKVADMAEKGKWTRDRLRDEIKKRKAARKSMSSPAENDVPASLTEPELLSVPVLAIPGTRRIILAKTGPYAGELAVDLGFSTYFQLSKVTADTGAFHDGDIVEFADESGEILFLTKTPSLDPATRLYFYNAYVSRVLDGDTIEAVIDLGFGIATTQVLRLRGIDAPEIVTRDGAEAKAFVESVIARPVGAKQSQDNGIATSSAKIRGGLLAMTKNPSIFIRTVKSDKYDRYLADVFFIDAHDEPVYLNNQLLEQGHAVKAGE